MLVVNEPTLVNELTLVGYPDGHVIFHPSIRGGALANGSMVPQGFGADHVPAGATPEENSRAAIRAISEARSALVIAWWCLARAPASLPNFCGHANTLQAGHLSCTTICRRLSAATIPEPVVVHRCRLTQRPVSSLIHFAGYSSKPLAHDCKQIWQEMTRCFGAPPGSKSDERH